MWRWSLVSAGVIALILVSYSITIGNVPTVVVYEDKAVSIKVSRWWDILTGPACVIPMLLIFAGKKESELEESELEKTACAIIGSSSIMFGLAISWLISQQDIRSGLLLIMLYGLFLGLVILLLDLAPPSSLWLGLFSGLVCCLTSALISGFGIGFILALAFAIASTITVFSGAILVGMLEGIRSDWKKFHKRLMAEEED